MQRGNSFKDNVSYTDLADIIPDIYFTLDKNLCYLYWNKAAQVFFNFSLKDIVGKTIYDVFPNFKNTDIEKVSLDVLKTKKSKNIKTFFEVGDFKYYFEIQAVPFKEGLAVFAKEITKEKLYQDDLLVSIKKYRELYEKSPLGYQSLDSDGNFLIVNDKWLETLGYEKKDVIGKCFADFLTPEFKDAFRQCFFKFKSIGKIYSEFKMICKDGSIKDIAFDGSIGNNPDGSFKQTHCVLRDVTEYKIIEKELRESEKNYRTLFNTSAEGILITEIKTHKIKYANPAICQMLGYTEKELTATNIDKIHPKKDLQVVLTKFKDNIGIRDPGTLTLVRKDGTNFYAEITGTLITVDGQECSAGFFHDVTEKKQQMEELEESKKTAERYLNIAAEIILSLDASGNITLLNESGHKLLGYNNNELIGKNWFKICLPDEISDTVFGEFKKLVKGDIENIATYENPVKTKDGEIKIILWHNALIKDANKNITGSISSGLDMTERKNAEDKIIYLSFHNHLTGLYNRRFFEEEIKRLDTKRQLPLSVIMGDLNGLKLINDTFGHNTGDNLLKEAAGLLKKVCRADDILARWGGDEFVILLPKTSTDVSEKIIQRIRKRCKETIIQKIPISISMGTATKTGMLQGLNEILMKAESNMYKNKLVERESNSHSILSALEQTLYEKSSETLDHALRIKSSAIKLGKSIKLHSDQIDELSLLASLHDIGKVAVPTAILMKEDKLTEEEWKIIKRHTEAGFNIAQASPQISHIAKYILYCHENWDGSGYPQGLKGNAIPIISRIIFICDSYDVMTNKRSYKKAMNQSDAIKELKRCAGTQFDPELVEKFIEII